MRRSIEFAAGVPKYQSFKTPSSISALGPPTDHAWNPCGEMIGAGSRVQTTPSGLKAWPIDPGVNRQPPAASQRALSATELPK